MRVLVVVLCVFYFWCSCFVVGALVLVVLFFFCLKDPINRKKKRIIGVLIDQIVIACDE